MQPAVYVPAQAEAQGEPVGSLHLVGSKQIECLAIAVRPSGHSLAGQLRLAQQHVRESVAKASGNGGVIGDSLGHPGEIPEGVAEYATWILVQRAVIDILAAELDRVARAHPGDAVFQANLLPADVVTEVLTDRRLPDTKS